MSSIIHILSKKIGYSFILLLSLGVNLYFLFLQESKDISPIVQTPATSSGVMKVGSDFIPVNQNNKTFYSFEKVNTDIIENIQTKEYLIALNSNFINLHEINNPKSIKLGKDRMLMYKHLSNITNPEFINASHSLRDIYAAKSLWNEELLQLDKEYKKVSDLETPSREQQGILEELKRMIMERIRNIRLTPQYQEYLISNKDQINKLVAEMRQYWTPEMIELEKEIEELNKELYRSK